MRQILQRDGAVRHEIIRRDGRIVENGNAKIDRIVELGLEDLVPHWGVRLWFRRAPENLDLIIDIDRNVRIDRMVVRLPETHRMAFLEVRGLQGAALTYLQFQRAREHGCGFLGRTARVVDSGQGNGFISKRGAFGWRHCT